jgi:hypothetical protein
MDAKLGNARLNASLPRPLLNGLLHTLLATLYPDSDSLLLLQIRRISRPVPLLLRRHISRYIPYPTKLYTSQNSIRLYTLRKAMDTHRRTVLAYRISHVCITPRFRTAR